jgi:hypothetical protein
MFMSNIQNGEKKSEQAQPVQPTQPSQPNAELNKEEPPASILNDARFWIALSIIFGMMIILIITVAQGQYTQAEQLAAIFSGWVTSIIAFYFLDKTMTQAQNQVKDSTKLQVQAQDKADEATTSQKDTQRKLNTVKSLVAAPVVQKTARAVMSEAATEETEATKVLRETILKVLDET